MNPNVLMEMEFVMKKTIRVIVPIVLALAIVLCSAWYLLIYDTGFTRDMFLHIARSFESQGSPQISAWFYDLAYQQSSDNDAVAIELAKQHAADGNFLQAEVTLTNAIADGASTQLYVALSNIYLEQDKLLDAVKMLDAVCGEKSTVDPAIRKELNKLRPKAPTSNLEPGFYDPDQQSSVQISISSGTLYLNRDGAYPSVGDSIHSQLVGAIGYIAKHGRLPLTEHGSYSESVALKEGENNLFALAISENGLVSPLSVFSYTLGAVQGGVVEEVTFVDAAMESAIRKALNVDSDAVVMTEDIWKLTSFTVPAEATDLTDMKHLLGVEDLTIQSAPEGQLPNLSSFTKLQSLTITDTVLQDTDVAAIGNLPKLTKLALQKCQLSSIAGLENAQKLESLDLTGNAISSITALRGITSLTELCLKENALSEISSVSGLTNLTKLDVSLNVLTSLSGVGNCTQLAELNVSNNRLTDISEVLKLSGLIRLNFSNNSVSSLPAWDKSCSLVTVDGSYNSITSLDPLSGLSQLNNVYMDYNENLQSVECLSSCPMLIQVNVYGTQVSNVKSLTDMSVIVKYDPT